MKPQPNKANVNYGMHIKSTRVRHTRLRVGIHVSMYVIENNRLVQMAMLHILVQYSLLQI